MIHRFIPSLIVASSLFTQMFAGTTGKITGKVTDATTGEALPNASVLVVGSTLGAITDFEGKYLIFGVPIGDITLKASFVGYKDVVITGIKVSADQTTPVNIKITSSAVEIGGVDVVAQQLVNPLTTSSVQTVSSKTIDQIPNVKSVEDVLALQAGVVKKGNNLFLRGGRANEVQYVVDGIPVNNIVGNSGELSTTSAVNEQLSQLYSQNQSGVIGGGSSGLAVSANAIQTVSVQTSGFDADYGNSQSGIVSIQTKSGGDRYNGSVQYRTDKVANTNFGESYGSFSFGGPEPLSKYLLPQLGVNIPGNLTFFLSSDMNRSDGAYQYDHNEYYNPIQRKLQFKGFLGGLLNGLGFNYNDNQRNSFTINSKIKYDLSGNDQFSYGYRASLGSGHGYISDWRYRADSSAISTSLSTQHVLSWTHFFGKQTFSRAYFGRVESNVTDDVYGLTPPEYSDASSSRDINKDNFNDLGTGQRWFKSATTVWTVRFDFNSQVHPLHLLKTGFEWNYEDIQSTEIAYPTVPITTVDGILYPPFPDSIRGQDRGLYPQYGIYRWNLNNYPNRGALYIQDNIEFEGLNLHVGLRYDYLDLGKQVYDPTFIEKWKQAANTTTAGQTGDDYEPQWPSKVTNGSTFLYYVLHGYFSPRLSIGYPVTDRIVFYFNYGHFLQFPERDQYFRDPFILGSSNNQIGNPDLKPQRTVQYESGFENQIADDMAFAIRAFYKDIFDYATLHKLPNALNNVYSNLDYASARGFEITVKKEFLTGLETNVSYSYQIAKGRASNPLASVFNPGFQLPRETPLDWDQSHTANVFVNYRVGRKEDAKLLGIPLDNYGISLTWSYGSGFPYTSYKPRDTDRNVNLQNNETRPYTSTVNFSLNKGFYVLDHINLVVTFDIENLLNRRNVNSVNSFTGRPNQYGDYDPDTKVIYEYYRTPYRIDPTIFEGGRQLFLGVRLNWE